MSSDLTRVRHVLEKKFFLNFALNVFFLRKNLRARSYSKIIGVARGVGPVGPGPLN